MSERAYKTHLQEHTNNKMNDNVEHMSENGHTISGTEDIFPKEGGNWYPTETSTLCKICGNSFKNQKGLNIHTTKMHPEWNQNLIQINDPPPPHNYSNNTDDPNKDQSSEVANIGQLSTILEAEVTIAKTIVDTTPKTTNREESLGNSKFTRPTSLHQAFFNDYEDDPIMDHTIVTNNKESTGNGQHNTIRSGYQHFGPRNNVNRLSSRPASHFEIQTNLETENDTPEEFLSFKYKDNAPLRELTDDIQAFQQELLDQATSIHNESYASNSKQPSLCKSATNSSGDFPTPPTSPFLREMHKNISPESVIRSDPINPHRRATLEHQNFNGPEYSTPLITDQHTGVHIPARKNPEHEEQRSMTIPTTTPNNEVLHQQRSIMKLRAQLVETNKHYETIMDSYKSEIEYKASLIIALQIEIDNKDIELSEVIEKNSNLSKLINSINYGDQRMIVESYEARMRAYDVSANKICKTMSETIQQARNSIKKANNNETISKNELLNCNKRLVTSEKREIHNNRLIDILKTKINQLTSKLQQSDLNLNSITKQSSKLQDLLSRETTVNNSLSQQLASVTQPYVSEAEQTNNLLREDMTQHSIPKQDFTKRNQPKKRSLSTESGTEHYQNDTNRDKTYNTDGNPKRMLTINETNINHEQDANMSEDEADADISDTRSNRNTSNSRYNYHSNHFDIPGNLLAGLTDNIKTLQASELYREDIQGAISLSRWLRSIEVILPSIEGRRFLAIRDGD